MVVKWLDNQVNYVLDAAKYENYVKHFDILICFAE